ncbi:MAG TPA: hypothetical protein VG755_02545 [Nannocystaceae bacterium]|nr:hypothetical protein [Nannocystaceae bacterium]
MRVETDRFASVRLFMGMSRSSLAMLVALVGCTDASTPVPAKTEPIADAPPLVADAPVAAIAAKPDAPTVAPKVLPTPEVEPTPKPVPASPLPDGPIPAFVIATASETIVAPIDATIVPERAPGIWVLDDAVVPFAVHFDEGDGAALSECACDRATACAGPFVVDAGTGPVCECHAPVVYDDAICEESTSWPVALVGGVLFEHVDVHDGCEGMNIYDVTSLAKPMVAKPASFAGIATKSLGCDLDGMTGGLAPVWPLDDDCADAATDCLRCDELTAEADIWMARVGALWRVEDEMDPVGAGRRRWSTVRLSPKLCPSAADTCGSPKHHDEIGDDDEYWIATDGVYSLRIAGSTLVIGGGGKSVPRGEIGSAEVIGVRWHADARVLVTTMRERAPRSITVCGASHSPGTQCVEHMRAKRFAEAKTACEAGLAATTKKSSRGALLYNLGRIAQLQGDIATARTRYRESLAARPKNKTVTKALAALPPE